MNGRVRAATVADCDALAELIAAFRDHLNATGPSDRMLMERLPALLVDSSLEFRIAEVLEKLVGYVQMRFLPTPWAGTEAFIDDLFVLPAFRRGGFARALLGSALAHARARGALTAALCANDRNEHALRLYSSSGFELHADPIWPGGREVRLQCSLGAEPG